MAHRRSAEMIGAAIVAGFAPLAAWATQPDAPRLYLPFAYPPDGSTMMGEAFAGPRSPIPGVTVPLSPSPKTSEPQSRAESLDDLFQRLAAAQDADEGKAVAIQIGIFWRRSGSETADLLMSRALEASRQGNSAVALALLDRLVGLQPDWAEAWDKRAFIRLIADDRSGAMDDIAHVLRLEPRHFVALASMAMLLKRADMQKQALVVLRRAAAIYPANVDLRQMIDQLVPLVEGQPT